MGKINKSMGVEINKWTGGWLHRGWGGDKREVSGGLGILIILM